MSAFVFGPAGFKSCAAVILGLKRFTVERELIEAQLEPKYLVY